MPEIILIHTWRSRGLIIEYLLLRRHHGRTHHSRTHNRLSHHRLPHQRLPHHRRTHHRRTHHWRTHHRLSHNRRTHYRLPHHWCAHNWLAKHRRWMHHHGLLRRNSIKILGRLAIAARLSRHWLSRVHATIIAGTTRLLLIKDTSA